MGVVCVEEEGSVLLLLLSVVVEAVVVVVEEVEAEVDESGCVVGSASEAQPK